MQTLIIYLLKKIFFESVPRDGSLIPTRDPNVFSYVDATQRMKEFEFNDVNFFPYHCDDYRPCVFKGKRPLKWILFAGVEYSGVFSLIDQNQDTLLVVKGRTYASAVKSGKQIIFYERAGTNLILKLYKLDDLKPMNISNKEMIEISKNGKDGILADAPYIQENITLPEGKLELNHEFNHEFKELGELIVIGDIPWLKKLPENQASTAILSVQPKSGKITIYPQDWFNQGDYDFGYQWITLAGRDPSNGQLQGTGIRLGNFQCDESGRRLVKGGKSVFF